MFMEAPATYAEKRRKNEIENSCLLYPLFVDIKTEMLSPVPLYRSREPCYKFSFSTDMCKYQPIVRVFYPSSFSE